MKDYVKEAKLVIEASEKGTPGMDYLMFEEFQIPLMIIMIEKLDEISQKMDKIPTELKPLARSILLAP